MGTRFYFTPPWPALLVNPGMNALPPSDSLTAALCILAAFAIALTILGVPAGETRQMIGDLAAIIPLYVVRKSGRGPQML
jgi:hypothetical protein